MVIAWFHQAGHESLRFPFRPWYPKKEEPSFADMLTILRRVSYDEKTESLLPKQLRTKTWVAQLTELLSRAGRDKLRPRMLPSQSGSPSDRRVEIDPRRRYRTAPKRAKLELS